MPRAKADETVTVRVPKGVPDRLRAATGQKFSTLVRWTIMALLDKYEAENRHTLTSEAQELGSAVRDMEIPKNV